MTVTKLDMAKIIVCALYNLDRLPAADHHHVKRLIKMKKDDLKENYQSALDIIRKKQKGEK